MNGSNDLLTISLQYAWLLAPVWFPFILGPICWDVFVRYKKKKFFAAQKYLVLEISVPKEVTKSPVAMELFLNTVWQTAGETTWYDRNFLGKTRAWFSLEIVSIDGFLHFYIWTREMFSRHIQSQIYAQYPGAEVKVVPDYAKMINFDPNKHAMFGMEYKLKKADPYPIKTYVDYGLNETVTKEEQKVDPLSQVLEFMGQINKGTQIWLQYICRSHKKEDPDYSKRIWWKPWTWNESKDNWTDEAIKEIKKIRSDNTSKYKDPMTGKEQEGFPNLTKGQMEVINALERSISKPGFDVGIRTIYIGEKENFHGASIPILVGLFKPFNSNTLNSFTVKDTTNFDYPWEDLKNIRQKRLQKDMIFYYKKRAYFYPPAKEKHMILNSEELASLYHFPGTVVQTPTLGRLLSKKAEPPSNLPT